MAQSASESGVWLGVPLGDIARAGGLSGVECEGEEEGVFGVREMASTGGEGDADARARLAAQQAELVRALVAGAAVPTEFAADRVELAARALVNKRLREVARVWPALVEALGEAFEPRFRAYAECTPPPAAGGPFADGRAFLATLAPGETTDELRRAALRADLAARRLALKWVWLPGARRILVGIRLPWLAPRVVSLPVFGR
jgi:hypothetical protein